MHTFAFKVQGSKHFQNRDGAINQKICLFCIFWNTEALRLGSTSSSALQSIPVLAYVSLSCFWIRFKISFVSIYTVFRCLNILLVTHPNHALHSTLTKIEQFLHSKSRTMCFHLICPTFCIIVKIILTIRLVEEIVFRRNFIFRDMKCGMSFLSHAAQLPVLNGCKCSLTFHESSNISFNISNLDYY